MCIRRSKATRGEKETIGRKVGTLTQGSKQRKYSCWVIALVADHDQAEPRSALLLSLQAAPAVPAVEVAVLGKAEAFRFLSSYQFPS